MSQRPSLPAQLPKNIKEEPDCSAPAPCHFSLKFSSLPKHDLAAPAAPIAATTAPAVTTDKDRMLQEKDKQIEELTRMLMQKQRLVELLRTQLADKKRNAQAQRRAPEPVVLVRIKQEPLDKPSVPPSSLSCDMDVTKVTVKQEAIDAEDVVSEVRSQSTDRLLQASSQSLEEKELVLLQRKPAQIRAQTKPQPQVRLQQTSLQLAQQQAIQKLLLQKQYQQQAILSRNQTLENQQNLQKRSQQRGKTLHEPQLKQQKQQQVVLKQHRSLVEQKMKHLHRTKEPQQLQMPTKIHLKQQQVLSQSDAAVNTSDLHAFTGKSMTVVLQNECYYFCFTQVSQAHLKQQSGSAPSFPLDLLKSDSTPTLVTDSHGNHFLIALTSQITENQRGDAAESKASVQVVD